MKIKAILFCSMLGFATMAGAQTKTHFLFATLFKSMPCSENNILFKKTVELTDAQAKTYITDLDKSLRAQYTRKEGYDNQKYLVSPNQVIIMYSYKNNDGKCAGYNALVAENFKAAEAAFETLKQRNKNKSYSEEGRWPEMKKN